MCAFHGSPGHPRLDSGVDSTAGSRQLLPWAILQLPSLCPQNNVVGRLCNECSDGSFHLSKQNPDGCLKCFCMGVSRQCSSSSWSRAQVPARGRQLDGTAGTEGGGNTATATTTPARSEHSPSPGARGLGTALSVQPEQRRRHPHHQRGGLVPCTRGAVVLFLPQPPV
jgi:hypothetical protein